MNEISLTQSNVSSIIFNIFVMFYENLLDFLKKLPSLQIGEYYYFYFAFVILG